MKPLPKEARNKNVTGNHPCRWCEDTGYVVVGSRVEKSAWVMSRKRLNANDAIPHEGTFEEYAPCPYCEAGFREEFPVPKADNKRPTKPPWGEEGFWRGRDPMEAEIQPARPHGFVPLPIEENTRRMRELTAKMETIVKPMPE